ncbi:hypothetical protein [Halomicrobium salinisoli]|uniref:hypothetical protein n=1 Tax=Halomicrobium salinisoli TaxID=2878391 RepID=UPI001CF0961E|nr:hypothetical protein [Halomicrobium salinisoli]
MTRDSDSRTGGTARGTDAGGGLPRRRFLRTVGAGALVGALGSTPASAQSTDTAFVRRDGTQLTIDGEPAYFHGSNNHWITNAHYGEPERIDAVFDVFEERDVDFVRTFVACEGGEAGCYIPEPYEHSEQGYESLDYLIDQAEQRGFRLNLILADNWDHNGGIAQYVDWVDGAEHHGDFFVNEDVKDLYRWHVEETLTRTNTITGREYREEPAIASWELCNEPRIEGDDFAGDSTPHEERASALEEWLSEMAAFVKELDDNHLVSSGFEGFYTRDDRTEWFYNEWTGQDFLRHHAIDEIDLCSFHWYPHHWEIPIEYGRTWIREHVRDAHEELGKPAYMGEFNVNRRTRDGLETRNEFLSEWYEAADAYDCDAATIWQLVQEGTQDNDGFQVYPGESDAVLAEYREAVEAKSRADLVTDGEDPVLVPPTGVDAVTSGSCIDLAWSTVSGAAEYAVSLDGNRVTTTSETSATLTDVDPDAEYEVGVIAVGPDGTETDAATRTVTTDGPTTVDAPTWERGTVYEGGDRTVWNGVVWEANWYTDEEEPRFEDGYAWSFVRLVGGARCGSDPETPTETPTDTPTETPTDTPTDTPNDTPTESPDEGPPAIGDGAAPTDPDGDGAYEDLNGNGEVDYQDVVEYFENMEEPAMTDYAEFYDYNGNGGIDYDDLVALFEQV